MRRGQVQASCILGLCFFGGSTFKIDLFSFLGNRLFQSFAASFISFAPADKLEAELCARSENVPLGSCF